jgi:hypothetical protein
MGFQTLVESFLHEEGLKYTVLKDGAILGFRMSGEKGKFDCFVTFDEKDDFILVHSLCGFNTPQEKRAEMAELLTRINFVIKIGNFELDFEDGEIRFKTSIRISPDEVSNEIIKHLILTNILSMNKAFPILMELIYGASSPSDLLEKFKDTNG